MKEVRTTFLIEASLRLILHYEHQAGIFRPLVGADDFDILINFRFHLEAFTLIKLKLSVDNKLPPIDVTTPNLRHGTVRKARNSGFFILEDVDDPILAPRISRGASNESVDPLLVYNSSFFVEELAPDTCDDNKYKPTSNCLEDESWSLRELVGQGGFGKVYCAVAANHNENSHGKRKLAVKVVDIDEDAEDEAIHILDEIDTLSNLSHRNALFIIVYL